MIKLILIWILYLFMACLSANLKNTFSHSKFVILIYVQHNFKWNFKDFISYLPKLDLPAWNESLISYLPMRDWTCIYINSSVCLPDTIISSERCHPAGYHTYGGQFKPETWERRAAAGLWSGRKLLLSQVTLWNS